MLLDVTKRQKEKMGASKRKKGEKLSAGTKNIRVGAAGGAGHEGESRLALVSQSESQRIILNLSKTA